MLLRSEQLPAHLAKTLAPIYLLSGAEPYLIETARQRIQQAAQRAGYSERQKWSVEAGFAWQTFLDAAAAFSLFSAQELLELHCPAAQLNEAAGKALLSYCARLPQGKILLIVTEKLTPAQQKSAWHQAINKAGCLLPVWPLVGEALARWLKQALQAVQLNVTPDGLQLLATYAENNLLAIAQEITKLSLLFPQQTLTRAQILDVVPDHARFDVFALSDALLTGDGHRIARILTCLRAEGVEPILILWAISKELRALTGLAEQLAQGATFEQACAAQRVWDQQKIKLRPALARHMVGNLHRLLQRAADLDCLIKGLQSGNIWDELLQLSLAVAGINLKL